MSYLTEAARWRALTSRDPLANGHFVYLVKSTNIYCRPTCPARLARRAQVSYAETPAQAEAAGYRACKRCKPNEEINTDPQELAVSKACSLIEEAVKKDDLKSIRLQDLAKNVGLTPRYFHKIFKDRTGLTPKEYAKAEAKDVPVVCCDVTAPAAIATAAAPFETTEQLTSEQSPLDFETFDFNDLDLDFMPGLDPSLSLEASPPLDTPLAQTPYSFGQDIDVNIQSYPSWDGTFDPNVLDAEFMANDKLANWHIPISEPPTTTTMGWESVPSMTPTVSTFELDAALIMSVENLPEYMHFTHAARTGV